jgi:hypothetical protein
MGFYAFPATEYLYHTYLSERGIFAYHAALLLNETHQKSRSSFSSQLLFTVQIILLNPLSLGE